jgi:hypothetical protein
MGVALRKMHESEGKTFKAKFRLAGILLNVNGMTYFTFQLQLKFRNNKYYAYIIVNFHTGLRSKYCNVNLKFRKNKSCHQKRTSLVVPHFSAV